MSWTLIEPCAGSAAFTLHMLGAKRAILPYQGSKWKFRHSLAVVAAKLGFLGHPKKVVLTDPGPWGVTLGVVLSPRLRQNLVEELKCIAELDPKDVYARLHGCRHARVPSIFAAQHLFLQRLAFSGKAVGIKDGRWASPGFNRTSAYGVPATNDFGEVKPMVPSLIRVLESYNTDLRPVDAEVKQKSAEAPTHPAGSPTLVYFDPPYEGSTSYPNGTMERLRVTTMGRAFQSSGASVIISESEPLPGLQGWERKQLYSGRKDSSPFRGKQEEWVTFKVGSGPSS